MYFKIIAVSSESEIKHHPIFDVYTPEREKAILLKAILAGLHKKPLKSTIPYKGSQFTLLGTMHDNPISPLFITKGSYRLALQLMLLKNPIFVQELVIGSNTTSYEDLLAGAFNRIKESAVAQKYMNVFGWHLLQRLPGFNAIHFLVGLDPIIEESQDDNNVSPPPVLFKKEFKIFRDLLLSCKLQLLAVKMGHMNCMLNYGIIHFPTLTHLLAQKLEENLTDLHQYQAIVEETNPIHPEYLWKVGLCSWNQLETIIEFPEIKEALT